MYHPFDVLRKYQEIHPQPHIGCVSHTPTRTSWPASLSIWMPSSQCTTNGSSVTRTGSEGYCNRTASSWSLNLSSKPEKMLLTAKMVKSLKKGRYCEVRAVAWPRLRCQWITETITHSGANAAPPPPDNHAPTLYTPRLRGWYKTRQRVRRGIDDILSTTNSVSFVSAAP